jgi:dihydrofolate reductase
VFYSIIPEGVLRCESLLGAIEQLSEPSYRNTIETIFIIGGASIYDQCFMKNSALQTLCDGIYFTRVDASIECDAFFPRAALEHFQEDISKRVHVEEEGFIYDIGYYYKP